MNKLASAVASYTPQVPVPRDVADGVRELVSDTLHKLAAQVDEYLAAASDGASLEEEEVIIITSPPP